MRLTQRSNRFWGLSPFKAEKTPSFSVDPEKGLYYCFSTHQGGTIFSFIMALEKVTFPEAVRHLAELAGVDIPKVSSDEKDHSDFLEVYQKISGSFHHILLHHPEADSARRYLIERGVDIQAMEKFCLGFAPDDPYWLPRFLEKHHYSPEFIRSSSLLTQDGKAFFRNRIMFPILNMRSEVVGFGGRTLTKSMAKYLNSRESPVFQKKQLLYSMPLAMKAVSAHKRVYLVEGYFDVIAMHQIKVANTLASLGTAMGVEQIRWIRRYVDTIVLVFDGDESGFQAMKRVALLCENMDITVQAVILEKDCDPAQMIADRKEEFSRLLQTAHNFFELYVKQVVVMKKGQADENLLVIKEIFMYIQNVESIAKRQLYLHFLADAIFLDRQSIMTDFQAYLRKQPVRQLEKKKENVKKTLDLTVTILALGNPEYFERFRSAIDPADLEDENARLLYYLTEQEYRKQFFSESENQAFGQVVIEKVPVQKLREYVINTLMSEEYRESGSQVLEDGIIRLRKRRWERKREEIEVQLRQWDVESRDRGEYKKLLEEKVYLDREINNVTKGRGSQRSVPV